MQVSKIAGIILLVTLSFWGCSESAEKEQTSKEPAAVQKKAVQKEAVKAPQPQKAASGDVDAYGRKPGDPHYGHGHATGQHPGQNAKAAEPAATGGPDKYGRMPGEPHYGHNHE